MFDCPFIYEEFIYELWSYPIIVFLIRQEEIKEIKTRMIKNYLQSIFFLNLCTAYFFMYNLRIIYLVGFQLLPMRLGKLENLDLRGNRLNSSILSILSGLSSLKSLDLSKNMFTGSGIIHSFYLPKCFTWHSLNYIVSLSTKMRTLYQEKRRLELGPRGIYFILILAFLCQKWCNI